MSTLEFTLIAVYLLSGVLVYAALSNLKTPPPAASTTGREILVKLLCVGLLLLVMAASPAALIWLGIHLLTTGNLVGAALAFVMLAGSVLRYARHVRKPGRFVYGRRA